MMLMLLSAVGAEAQQTEPRYDPNGAKQRIDSLLEERVRREADDPSEEDVQGRWDWFYYQRAFPYDIVPADVRTRAIRETQAMERRLNESRGKDRSTTLAAKQWEQIGPYNISGRIRGLAIDPKGSGTLFIGAASGGVWKNNGTNPNDWTTTFDKQSALAVGAVAIDPVNPQIIYAATGEPLPQISLYYASPAYWGDGVFKSTDGGASWFNVGLRNVGAFSKIHVHRGNPQIVYAAGTQSGGNFYRSEDGGQNWTQGFTGATNCFDMVVNPKNSNTVYITTNGSVWRSRGGGKAGTWSQVNSGINFSQSRGVSIAMSASDTNILYVMTARTILQGGMDQGDVYVTTNGGTSWKNVGTFNQDFFRDQGYYNNCLAVHPFDPNIVLAGGVQLRYTTDGLNANSNSWVQVGGEVELHPDQHVIEFDPVNSDIVYVGNDGGLWVSYDAGASWTHYSTNLPITQFYQMDVDQTRQFRVFGGTQDNGTIGAITDDKFADRWVNLVGGDGFYTVVDKSDPNVMYGEVYYGDLTRTEGPNYGSKTKIDGSISGDDGQWSTPMEMSPADKKTLYQGRSALYRLKDPRGGNLTWEKLTVTGMGGKISAIGLSPFDATKMAVGASGGGVFFSINDGKTWTRSNGLANRYVADLIWDPNEPNRLYAVISGTGGGHIYRSDDNGASFTNITNNLPDVPTSAMEVDPADNTHLFVGNDAGMFLSLDGGQSWLPFNAGLPYVPVTDLKVQRQFRKLYAATYGRSIFRIDLDNPQGEPFVVSPAGGASFNSPTDLPIRWAGFDGPVRVQISYDNGNTWVLINEDVPPTQTELNYPLPIVNSTTVRIRITEKSSGRIAESGTFTVKPTANATTLDFKSAAEALAVRGNRIWITVRNTDTIRIVASTSLTGTQFKLRSGFTGKIRDLAYDQTGDVFYALVADEDFSNAHVYRMDTNAVNKGEITLPSQAPSRISGITMTPQGLALVSPGREGKIVVVDPSATPATLVSESSALAGAAGDVRMGLTFDGQAYVQGVVDARAGEQYPSELQLEKVTDQFRVHQRTIAVTPVGGQVSFFAVEYDPTVINGKTSFLATDTAGRLFRFTRDVVFSGAESPVVGVRAGTATIGSVTPNPLRGEGSATLRIKTRSAVTLDLYTSAGDRVARLFDGIAEQGMMTVPFDASKIPSGVYYMTLATESGERDVRPVVVVK